MSGARSHDEFMDDLQPIIDRLAGEQVPNCSRYPYYSAVRCARIMRGNKDADNLPPGCDGCREELGGELQCCQCPGDQA